VEPSPSYALVEEAERQAQQAATEDFGGEDEVEA